MRKIILSLSVLFLGHSIAFAQFAGTNCVQASKLNIPITKMNEFFACNGAASNPELTYNYTSPTTFVWYKYTTTPSAKVQVFSESNVMSSTFINPDLNCGYVVEFDGKRRYCWLIDINDYPIKFGEITASKGTNPCVSTSLTVNFSKLTELSYVDSVGSTKKIPRVITIKYNTLEWNESASTYNTKEMLEEQSVFGAGDSISKVLELPSPYMTTTFTATGDKFLLALNQIQASPSAEFTPSAVIQNLTGAISEREYLNEIDKNTGVLTGSAPLNIDFKSNTNFPICQHWEWYISSKEDPNNKIYYTDTDLRYTFKNTGLFTVKLVASNGECSSTDSASVTVIASSLEVPNVFTPNGDGKNDEFRVAYKSLIKFEGVVYNRWGRVVYRWTDPGKGWDGRIAGRMALPGPYYYIIEAEGSDIDPATNRARKYKKKGDINLLRGK